VPTQQTLPVNVLEYIPTRPGGDLQGVWNLEYRIPIVSRVTFDLFNDFGINGVLRPSQLSLDPTAVASLQQQFPNPDFPNLRPSNNLPILGGTNFRPHTSAGAEFVVFLPIVNAPFRFYYAYNYLRLRRTLTPPLGAYYFTPEIENSLKQLGVYNTQVVPALQTFLEQLQSSQTIPPTLLEPKSTFRFTVSRTF
jgi:outer membrane protein insertion porin family